MRKAGALYICNRCSDEIFFETDNSERTAETIGLEARGVFKISSSFHLCESCYKDFESFMKGGTVK